MFLPSNEAFAAAANGTTSTSKLISNHVVSGFVGYLPTLTDGLNLTTEAGDILTVSILDDIWYINNAKITQANLVLENGVAHVIDQVRCFPLPPPCTPRFCYSHGANSIHQTLQVLVPTPAKVVTSSGNPVLGSTLATLLCVPLALLSLLF